MMCLHVEGCFVGPTKMHEGYMWKAGWQAQLKYM